MGLQWIQGVLGQVEAIWQVTTAIRRLTNIQQVNLWLLKADVQVEQQEVLLTSRISWAWSVAAPPVTMTDLLQSVVPHPSPWQTSSSLLSPIFVAGNQLELKWIFSLNYLKDNINFSFSANYQNEIWLEIVLLATDFTISNGLISTQQHSCQWRHAILRMYIVPVVVMATTEATLTILGHGKQSEYSRIQRYSDHLGIVLGWAYTTHNPPCQSIPGCRDTPTIPGLRPHRTTPAWPGHEAGLTLLCWWLWALKSGRQWMLQLELDYQGRPRQPSQTGKVQKINWDACVWTLDFFSKFTDVGREW